jgi:hypothetical protein
MSDLEIIIVVFVGIPVILKMFCVFTQIKEDNDILNKEPLLTDEDYDYMNEYVEGIKEVYNAKR